MEWRDDKTAGWDDDEIDVPRGTRTFKWLSGQPTGTHVWEVEGTEGLPWHGHVMGDLARELGVSQHDMWPAVRTGIVYHHPDKGFEFMDYDDGHPDDILDHVNRIMWGDSDSNGNGDDDAPVTPQEAPGGHTSSWDDLDVDLGGAEPQKPVQGLQGYDPAAFIWHPNDGIVGFGRYHDDVFRQMYQQGERPTAEHIQGRYYPATDYMELYNASPSFDPFDQANHDRLKDEIRNGYDSVKEQFKSFDPRTAGWDDDEYVWANQDNPPFEPTYGIPLDTEDLSDAVGFDPQYDDNGEHPFNKWPATMNRRPYVYDPEMKQIYWGSPGSYHGAILDQMAYLPEYYNDDDQEYTQDLHSHPGLILGAVTNDKQHMVWRWPKQSEPGLREHLEGLVGLPINNDLDPHGMPVKRAGWDDDWEDDDFDWLPRAHRQEITWQPGDGHEAIPRPSIFQDDEGQVRHTTWADSMDPEVEEKLIGKIGIPIDWSRNGEGWVAQDREPKTSMAADPEWVKQWIAENGPYLYHGVTGRGQDENVLLQSILKNGLMPDGDGRYTERRQIPKAEDYDWTDADPENYDFPHDYDADMDEWWHTPRPGHVFLTTKPEDAYGKHLLRIDIRGLDPKNFNPDDDYLRDTGDTVGPMLVPGQEYTMLPNSPFKDWDEVRQNLKTLGEQAEEQGWGDNPEDTHDSWEAHPVHSGGVVAHRGMIPPHLIEHVASRDDQHGDWNWHTAKTSMAEKTGDPTLDKLIEEFMSGHFHGEWPDGWEAMHEDGELEGEWGSPVPVEKFRHPGVSEGMCYEMADELATFLGERGIKAYTSDDVAIGNPNIENLDRFPWKGRDSEPADFGITAPDWMPHHNWAIVEMPSGTYGVDFTASQFDEQEFPLVQRLQDGQWQRKWAAASTVESLMQEIEDISGGHIPAEDEWEYDHNWCGKTCEEVSQLLTQHGIQHKVIEGVYDGMVHTWIELTDGRILDPTVAQFSDDRYGGSTYLGPKTEHYGEWPWKTAAAPTVMYHVAPQSAREGIAADQILWAGESPDADEQGVYFFDNLEHAHGFGNRFFPGAYDIWEVVLDPYDIQYMRPDPLEDGGWMVPSEDAVTPDRLKLVDPSQTSQEGPGADATAKTGAGLAQQHQQILDANRGQDLQGLPGAVNVPGYGPLTFGSHREIQDLARRYAEQAGLPYQPPQTYARVDPERARRIAAHYGAMKHAPSDPNVKASYDAMIRETMAQYQALKAAGYHFEFYPQEDPYPNSPREALLDLHHRKHMYVFPTVEGFGTVNDADNDHPLLKDSGERWGGKPVTYNDLFRAVHDVFGHAKNGVGFRADGEENAWRAHSAMYSPLARGAMTAETRGQNSFVNYGPNGAHNQTANQADTIYADQKAGLLPDWVTTEGAHD